METTRMESKAETLSTHSAIKPKETSNGRTTKVPDHFSREFKDLINEFYINDGIRELKA